MLIGAFLCARFMPNPKPDVPPIAIKQDQSAKCIASLKKHTNADGSVDESFDFQGESKQSQELVLPIKPEFNHSISLLNDELSYSYKYIKTNKFELSPLGQIRKDKSLHAGVQINF